MRIFAIGDLHLSKQDKPMDIFGREWIDHSRKIKEAWLRFVANDDVVLIPGDISWAMGLEDAYEDLADILTLPGEKIFIRGNHDYWWSSYRKVINAFSEFKNAHFLQNNSISIGDYAFVGTRGWLIPSCAGYTTADERIYKRELIRFEMSLQSAQKDKRKIAMLHFPPLFSDQVISGFVELLEKYEVDTVVYAHLHGKSCKSGFEGIRNGVRYILCSADYINFTPVTIKN